MNAVLSEKGQITIPKKLRDDLGLLPGSVLDFREEAGSVEGSVIHIDTFSAFGIG